MKNKVFPKIYWNVANKGNWFGKNNFLKPKF